MRRYLAAGLLFVLVAQASGSALAAAPDVGGYNQAGFLAPLFSEIESSPIVAQLTGNGERYALMHMPTPRVTRRPLTRSPREFNIRTSRLAHVHFRPGTREELHLPAAPPRDNLPGTRLPPSSERKT